MDSGYVWAAAGLALVVAELFVLDLTFVLLAVAAGGAAGAAAAGLPFPVQVLVFAGLAIVGLVFVRPLARRWLPRTAKTNVDAIPGTRAKALEDVTVDGGLILLRGEQWSARLDRDISEEPVPAGADVIVTRIDGATALIHTL